MANIHKTRSNLKYLKKLTNELCSKLDPDKKNRDKITNIKQVLQKRDQAKPEELLDEILAILNEQHG